MRSAKLEKAALLVVDVQRYFFEKEFDGYLSGSKKIVPKINSAIAKFRSEGLTVIFTRHGHERGEPLGQMGRWWNERLPWLEKPESAILKDLDFKKTDTLIIKNKYSAFEGTNLKALLKKLKVNTIFICGVMTHVCVETTARHAFLLDFQPVVLADACADLSEHHHKGALLNLGHAFALIKCVKDLKVMI